MRGLQEEATRNRLTEIAFQYEAVVRERDELGRRVGELEAGRVDYEAVVRERDELGRRVGELEAGRVDCEAVVRERDELRHRVEVLQDRVDELDQGETEQLLRKALLAAGRAGDELVQEARAEAEAIVTAALKEVEEAERELEERRRSFVDERDALLERLRDEALAAARNDLASMQQDADLLVDALVAFSGRIGAIGRLEPVALEDGPRDELLEDLRMPPASIEP